MKKITFLMSFLLMAICSVNAQDVILVDQSQGNDSGTSGGITRSLAVSPSAFQDGSSLIIDFPMPTVSQVIIRDAETGAVVYSASYDATRQVVVNLSSLPEGTYELHVYACGKWWCGEFELEED